MICKGQRPLDELMVIYWGNGFNLPSVHFILFAIITCLLCYATFSLLENEVVLGKKIVDLFALLGKYTLYTFMYHLLVRDIILQYFPNIINSNIIIRICILFFIVIVPVIIVIAVKKLWHKIFVNYKMKVDGEKSKE